MVSNQNPCGLGESRRNSSVRNGENEPLLPEAQEPSLYRTISHSSAFPPHDTDLENGADKVKSNKTAGIYATLSVLLLGVFVSQTDQSFVLATYVNISSEFNDLAAGSWIMSSYILAQCVAQPLYGKMSDIYGRKACLQAAYILFALGTAGSGLGRSMGEVIASRAVQGAGGAGMVSMVAIIITDLVPLNEVASMWSYINILQVIGRSCGGFLGGLLTQSLGWRWAFLIQVPPVLIGILLVQWQLKLPRRGDDEALSKYEKLKRVDFVGALLLCLTIFAACFVIDVGGQKLAWNSPTLIGIIVGGAVSAVLFVVSARRHPEPIFPLRFITQFELASNYAIVTLQLMVQVSLMLSVPLYFQATKNARTAEAGAYLIPAFIGNASGGLVSGYWIRKTSRYKWPTVSAPLISISCMLLCLTWNGNTSVWESLYIFPGGFAIGMISNSAFVGMAAAVDSEDVAIAGSAMYLFFNIGAIAGTSAGGAVYQSSLKSSLRNELRGVNGRSKILRRLLQDIKYLQSLDEKLRQMVIPAYVQSFHRVMILGLICAALSLVIAVFTKSRRLATKA